MSRLPVRRVQEIEARAESRRWLVEGLWAERAVGIVGGEPKCCKTFLALDVAVSVASGAPCLRRFPVARTGRVLLYAAEDGLDTVRRRLEGIAWAADVDFDGLDIQVITAPSMRLDLREDQRRLQETIERLRPILLVLDPFVRLHRIDENVVSDVAPVLGYLRGLERRFAMAVLLVHHARKGAGHARAGQALRGSSEIHAWGDSNLYLRRKGDALRLSVEHRDAPSIEDLSVELLAEGQALALHACEPQQDGDPARADRMPSALERVEQALARASGPLTQRELRRVCRMRTSSLGDAVAALCAQGRVVKSTDGYMLEQQ